VAQLKKQKRIRSIGPRLYASVAPSHTAEAVRASWSGIVTTLFPDALISHRTALEFKPSPAGEVILTSTTNRRVNYPGLCLRFIRGPGPLPDDPRFLAGRVTSRARAFLENFSETRRSDLAATVPRNALEERLEQILHLEGEEALGALRDRARVIARKFGWSRQWKRLDGVIGALLGTRADRLASAAGRSRAAGAPFDPRCLQRLQELFAELRSRSLSPLKDPIESPDHFRNKAFFEAYFSNFIEGTTFDLEEAEAIIFDQQLPAGRPADAHDILGTFQLVADPNEMRRTPHTGVELVELLQARHRVMLARRPEASTGLLKTTVNRAGETVFVAPEYVSGTLAEGMDLHAELRPGLPRAIFIMFLVSDVHPFTDGNGRLARVMMNAELTAAGEATIIIPTVYRDDYLGALRALTRRHRPDPLIQMLSTAQKFSFLDFTHYPETVKHLRRRNWFREPDSARIIL
jgi:hypothetical protein